MRHHLSIVVILASVAPISAKPAPTPAITPEEIREAIKNLDDSQYRVRTQAAKKLLSAGKQAIEPLTKAAESGPIEAADRAMKILDELAFNGNEETMPPAREAIKKLAQSKFQSRGQALEILNRYRGQVMDQMQLAGAKLYFVDRMARAIILNAVQDLKAVLPLLSEFPELEAVVAENKKFGDEEMKYLLPLKNLRYLNLSTSNVGDEGLKHLKNFPKLKWIPMGKTRVTDKGLEHLAELTQLDNVELRGNNITDAGLVHLKNLTNLRRLALEETKVNGAGFVHLREMTKLEYLELCDTPINDEGLKNLQSIKSLRTIALTRTKVTDKGKTELRTAIPEIRIDDHKGFD